MKVSRLVDLMASTFASNSGTKVLNVGIRVEEMTVPRAGRASMVVMVILLGGVARKEVRLG